MPYDDPNDVDETARCPYCDLDNLLDPLALPHNGQPIEWACTLCHGVFYLPGRSVEAELDEAA